MMRRRVRAATARLGWEAVMLAESRFPRRQRYRRQQ